MRIHTIPIALLVALAASASPKLTSTARIAGANEPGERMIITGTLFHPDGRTPAPGVVLTLHHTNAKGIYPRRAGDPREGYLRGALKTDAQGRYRIESIRPGPYPGRTDPAHIHIHAKNEGQPDRSLDVIVFADDPRVAAYHGTERFNVVTLTKRNGVWTGMRNLVLPK
jgi:protocatechuate 3,4-dioxygenase beta subunit